jgi:hypothetical protein
LGCCLGNWASKGCRLPKSYPKPKSQYHGVEIKQLSGLS